MTMLAARPATAPTLPAHDVVRSPASPATTRKPYYLVGEAERGVPRIAAAPGRTLVCINGRWHGLVGEVATFEQIIALAYSEPGRPWTSVSVSFRRGATTRPTGSLTPGDVVPIASGMLINAQPTVQC